MLVTPRLPAPTARPSRGRFALLCLPACCGAVVAGCFPLPVEPLALLPPGVAPAVRADVKGGKLDVRTRGDARR